MIYSYVLYIFALLNVLHKTPNSSFQNNNNNLSRLATFSPLLHINKYLSDISNGIISPGSSWGEEGSPLRKVHSLQVNVSTDIISILEAQSVKSEDLFPLCGTAISVLISLTYRLNVKQLLRPPSPFFHLLTCLQHNNIFAQEPRRLLALSLLLLRCLLHAKRKYIITATGLCDLQLG